MDRGGKPGENVISDTRIRARCKREGESKIIGGPGIRGPPDTDRKKGLIQIFKIFSSLVPISRV